MRKVLLASFTILFAAASQAQTSGDVTLNVNLNPIQTLVVLPSQTTVDLDYVTENDYASGVSAMQQNHLKIFSTGGFAVSVKASGDLTKSVSGGNGNIDAASVRITASAGTNDALASASYTANGVALSTGDQNIVTSTLGAVDKNININYAAAGANAYIDKYVAGQTATVFTTTVTYTIVAQ
ncbi:hypothetical protein NU10_12025 [Flavobacterium dauae]|uniref:hypothetical protein n=1 Tax=Flavobacterium dauae TaxID=1563479 RepID=UPI00101B44DF|nr:hypothetical protein [Flavobacterium dauae]WLD23428.1 hypothetical protein NU10_12025 [Flavobacterium dauae]